jgi:hypothetical protein
VRQPGHSKRRGEQGVARLRPSDFIYHPSYGLGTVVAVRSETIEASFRRGRVEFARTTRGLRVVPEYALMGRPKWHPLGSGAVEALQRAGLVLCDDEDGPVLCMPGRRRRPLLSLRRLDGQRLEARCAIRPQGGGISTRQASLYRLAADIDRTLAGHDSALRTPNLARALRTAGKALGEPRQTHGHSVWAASAGLPTLGKRR